MEGPGPGRSGCRRLRGNALPPVASAAQADRRHRRQCAFLGIYSAVAAATLGWLALAYRAAPAGTPLWPVGDGLWATATVVMLVASVLLMGSIVRNPALPNPGSPTPAPTEARGVFAVTRHPMMWGFALWGFCHIAVYPVAANIIVAAAIIILALVGAALQDRKKEALQPSLGPNGKGRPAIGCLARSSPVRRGSAGSACTRWPVA